VNLLFSQVQIGLAKPIKKIGQPLFEGPAFFVIGSGGVICAVPTVPTRVRLK